MATGKVSNIEAQFPKYTNSISLDSYAVSDTFTVSRTGFFLLYVNPQTSSGSYYTIKKSTQYVAIVNPISGSPSAMLCYLVAGQTYNVGHKTNVSHAYLYY